MSGAIGKRLVHFGRGERGKGVVWLALALPVLIGFVGLTVDGGRLYLSRQRVVNTVDAATYAGSRHLTGTSTDVTAVRADVLQTLASNVASADAEWLVTVSDAVMDANPDILVAGFNDTPATNSALTEPVTWLRDDGTPINPDNPPTFAPDPGTGVLVRGRTTSRSTFMSVLGFGPTAIGGNAIVITDCAGTVLGGAHVIPVWITGEFTPGQEYNLALNDGNSPIPSGSYGFLSPGSFSPYTYNNSAFISWLQFGTPTDASLSIYEDGPIQVGTPGVVTAHTGWRWGQVDHALVRNPSAGGNRAQNGARMERAALLYPDDEPSGGACGAPPGADPESPDIDGANPRIVVVPIVEYQFGTGSGATFKVTAFGAFWINCIGNSSQKNIHANFISYVTPGSGPGPCTGVRVRQLVR